MTVLAAGEFETRFYSTYEIDDNAGARVTHKISLTNLSANIYASEYSVTVGSTDVRSAQAFDDKGGLRLTSAASENSTTLTVFLDQRPVVGLMKTKSFSVQYATGDAATKVGRILEINIPKTANSNEFADYSITIVVPKKFGSPSKVIPDYTSIKETSQNSIVSFNKEQLKSGVTAVFGTKQSFLLKLSYYLENKSSFGAEKTIALVPDTPRQRVEYKNLNPRPKKIETDSDGNWLGVYDVPAGEKLAVTAEAVAEVYLEPAVEISTGRAEDYLGETDYWQVQDPTIKQLADKLKSPKEIYDFVTETLSYDYSRAENGVRRGAVAALGAPNESICTEFTDLFIALSRAAGIPAREHDGFAFTTNPKLRPLSLKKDILHAWPEYWDKDRRQWIEVDPTWAKTTGGIDYFSKLDLSHITFVTHGKSATSPTPAGFYKTKDSQTKTVLVEPTEVETATAPKILISAYIPELLSNWKKNKVKFEIANRGGSAAYDLPVLVDSTYTIIDSHRTQNGVTLLPWQTFTGIIELKPAGGWNETKGILSIGIGTLAVGKIYDLTSGPPISKSAAVAILIALVGLLAAAAAFGARRLRVLREEQ